jgi:hypothetical protein
MNWKFWEKKKKPTHVHDWVVVHDSQQDGGYFYAANLSKDFPELIPLFQGHRRLSHVGGIYKLQIPEYAIRYQDVVCATCDAVQSALTQKVSEMLDYHLKYTCPEKMEEKIQRVAEKKRSIISETLDKYDVPSHRIVGLDID